MHLPVPLFCTPLPPMAWSKVATAIPQGSPYHPPRYCCSTAVKRLLKLVKPLARHTIADAAVVAKAPKAVVAAAAVGGMGTLVAVIPPHLPARANARGAAAGRWIAVGRSFGSSDIWGPRQKCLQQTLRRKGTELPRPAAVENLREAVHMMTAPQVVL